MFNSESAKFLFSGVLWQFAKFLACQIYPLYGIVILVENGYFVEYMYSSLLPSVLLYMYSPSESDLTQGQDRSQVPLLPVRHITVLSLPPKLTMSLLAYRMPQFPQVTMNLTQKNQA